MTKVTIIPGKPGKPTSEHIFEVDRFKTIYGYIEHRKVEVREATPGEPERVVIETDRETAEILITLLGGISGPGEGTDGTPIRKKTQALYHALSDASPERKIYRARVNGVDYTLVDNIRWKLA